MFSWDISNRSYPKGLIVAFKLKGMQVDEFTRQKGASKVTNTTDGCKPEVPNSSGSVDEEGLENVKYNEEKSSDDASENHVQEGEEVATGDAAEESKDDGTNGSSGKTLVTREDLKQVSRKFGIVMVSCNFSLFHFLLYQNFCCPSALLIFLMWQLPYPSIFHAASNPFSVYPC